MKGKNRILLILFLLLTPWAYSQNQTLKKVKFLPMWVPQPQFAGYYVAREKGIYEKYGLDVNIISGGFDRNVNSYLQEGIADFGIMYLSNALTNYSDDNLLVNIGQMFQSSEIAFVTKKKSGIDSIDDFAGKKIAVWRTILKELTIGFLNKYNIEAELIQMNEGVNLFLKDAVDVCAVMHYNEYNNLINSGINPDELNVFYLKDYEMNFPEDGIYCLQKTYYDNPELCRNFVKASMEGWEYVFKNQEESLKIIEKFQIADNIPFSKAHSRWMLQCLNDVIQPPGKQVSMGELLQSDFDNTVEFLLGNNSIKKKPEYSTFFRGGN